MPSVTNSGARDNTAQPGALRFVFSPNALKRSLLIAVVARILLSMASQYDVLMRDPIGPNIAIKRFFNFLIPFTVASVSALLNRNSP
jgi:hypothetical protein